MDYQLRYSPTKKGALKALKTSLSYDIPMRLLRFQLVKACTDMARLYTKFNDSASNKSRVHIGFPRETHGVEGVTNSLCACVYAFRVSQRNSCHTVAIQLPYSCHTVAIQVPYSAIRCHILVASLKWRCNKFIFNWRLRSQVAAEADSQFMPVENATCCCCFLGYR